MRLCADEGIEICIALCGKGYDLVEIVAALGFDRNHALVSDRLQMLDTAPNIDHTVTDGNADLFRIDILCVAMDNAVCNALQDEQLVLAVSGGLIARLVVAAFDKARERMREKGIEP